MPWCSREKTGNLHVQHPSKPHPMGLFFWLVLICIFYNKSVIIRITLSWVLWVILMNHWTQEDSENPWICSQLVRRRGDLETLRFVASVWNHGSLVGDCVLKLWILTRVTGVRIALQFFKCQINFAPLKKNPPTHKIYPLKISLISFFKYFIRDFFINIYERHCSIFFFSFNIF